MKRKLLLIFYIFVVLVISLAAANFIGKYIARNKFISNIEAALNHERSAKKIYFNLAWDGFELQENLKMVDSLASGFEVSSGELYLNEYGWLYNLKTNKRSKIMCVVQPFNSWQVYCAET